MTRSFLAAVLLLPLVTACGKSDKDADTDANTGGDADTDADTDTDTDTDTPGTAPTVLSTNPADGAVDVPLNRVPSATFSDAMNPDSLEAGLTLRAGTPPVLIDGTVVYSAGKALFRPDAPLAIETLYTMTVTQDATSAAGVPLAEDYVWTFTTGATTEPGVPVDLGAAVGFAVLAKSAVSTVPPSAITGNVGLSPAAGSFLTGFSLTLDATNTFATSPQVTGRVFAADFAPPTPAGLTTAVGDMELAFTDAAGRAPDLTELGAGDIGGMTLGAGVYKWGTGLLIPTDVTLDGSATDVWIFQIGQDLTVSNGARVTLSGGARASNVFWQVAGLVDVGTTAHLEGTILTQTAASLHTGATVQGRILAQTAVTLDATAVVLPAP